MSLSSLTPSPSHSAATQPAPPPAASPSTPPVLRRVAELREQVAAWRREGLSVALVPTMGALHQGHATLMRRARDLADRVVVSIFVNPTQFGPNEDFAAYPRQEEKDLAVLAREGVSLLWSPTVGEMYPRGFATRIEPGPLAEGLCGPFRPGHFSGVATVVTKLLLQVRPDVACFGEKDYQQLQVIRATVRDLDIAVRIEGVATVREEDDLALSSRNAYLSAEERARAALLPRLLRETAAKLARPGANFDEILMASKRWLTENGFGPLDYLDARDAGDLHVLAGSEVRLDRPARLFVAVRLGKTRLIDNVPIGN